MQVAGICFMVEINFLSECIKILGKKWPLWDPTTQVIYEDGWAVKMKYLFMYYKIIFSCCAPDLFYYIYMSYKKIYADW